jgi:hypothetical protein
MKIHTLGWLVALPALAVPCLSSCSQASTVCVAAHAGTPGADQFGTPISVGFAATFTPKAAPRGCGMTDTYSMPYGPGPTFGRKDVPLADLKGDIIGFETYHPKKQTGDQVAPDFSTGLVAWQADALGVTLQDRDADPSTDHRPYGQGTWTSVEPDANGICTVKDVKPAEQNLPKVDAVPPDMKNPKGSPEIPASTIKYEWTNLTMYVTAAAQGTQFTADLAYTQDACSADFRVRGIWPLVGCIKLDKDGNPAGKDGKSLLDDDGNPTGPFVPDDSLCCPDASLAAGRAVGSGINPDFPTKCDPTLLYCVLDAPDNAAFPVLLSEADKKKRDDACNGGTPAAK